MALLVLIVSTMFFASVHADSAATEDIYIHYFRYAEDYSTWELWVWESEPDALEGATYSFATDDTAAEYNYGGVVCHINIADSFPGATEIGLIVKTASWDKDISSDRLVTIPATSENGEMHIYLVEGDTRIGTSINDAEGPNKNPKFKVAYFTALDEIYFNATEDLPAANITVKADGVAVATSEITVDGTSGYIY